MSETVMSRRYCIHVAPLLTNHNIVSNKLYYDCENDFSFPVHTTLLSIFLMNFSMDCLDSIYQSSFFMNVLGNSYRPTK